MHRPPHRRLLRLRLFRRSRVRPDAGSRDSGGDHGRRRRLRSDVDSQDLPHPAAEHRRPGSDLRPHPGRAVRPDGPAVDRHRLHLRRCGARLFRRHAVDSRQRRKHPQRGGTRTWHLLQAVHELLLGRAADPGRRRLRARPGQAARQHDRHAGVGVAGDHFRLLLLRHHPADRQADRPPVSGIRRAASVHVRRPDHRPGHFARPHAHARRPDGSKTPIRRTCRFGR